MQAISDYRIVRARTTDDLVFLVKEWVEKDCYQPLGPPTVSVCSNEREYIQALVLYTVPLHF